MEELADLVLGESAAQLDEILGVDKAHSSAPLLAALQSVVHLRAMSDQGRLARIDKTSNLTLEVCRAHIATLPASVPKMVSTLQTLELFVSSTIAHLGPAILVPADEHAIQEEEYQLQACRRLFKALPNDPDPMKPPEAGFSRYKMLAVVHNDLQTIRATVEEMGRTGAYADLSLVGDSVRHAHYILHECFIPMEMSEAVDPDGPRKTTSNIAELFREEEIVRANLARQQQVAIAVIVKTATDNHPLASTDWTAKPDSGDLHTALNYCASVLEVCSLYLLMLLKLQCAVPTVAIDECAKEDARAVAGIARGEIVATADAIGASGCEIPRSGLHASLQFVNGTVLAETGQLGSMIAGLQTAAESFADRVASRPEYPLLKQVTVALGLLTSARPTSRELGGDREDATRWACVSALVCAMPYVQACVRLADPRPAFVQPLAEGALSFFSGLTFGEGLRGGGGIQTAMLCFVSLQVMAKRNK